MISKILEPLYSATANAAPANMVKTIKKTKQIDAIFFKLYISLKYLLSQYQCSAQKPATIL